MDSKKAVILLIVATTLGIIIGFGIFKFFTIDSVQKYDIELTIAEPGKGGFNVATDKIYFGKVPPGGTGKRTIALYGSNERDVEAHFKVEGEIWKWVLLEDNGFIIPQGEQRNLTISVIIPWNETPGTEYSAVLVGKFFKVR